MISNAVKIRGRSIKIPIQRIGIVHKSTSGLFIDDNPVYYGSLLELLARMESLKTKKDVIVYRDNLNVQYMLNKDVRYMVDDNYNVQIISPAIPAKWHYETKELAIDEALRLHNEEVIEVADKIKRCFIKIAEVISGSELIPTTT